MMRKNEEQIVSIHTLNKKGWGVCQSGISSIEVIGSVPGDELKVKLWAKKRKKWRADLLEVINPSPFRVQPACVHVPLCGGCSWQQIDYAEQLREKERRVNHLFSPSLCSSILPALTPWRYRNKMEFSFSQNKAGDSFLGLVLAGSKGHVFNLTECHLVSPWYAHLLSLVRAWWQESGLLAYRINNTGSLRTLTVREGKNTGDKLVLLTVSGNPDYALNQTHLKGFIEVVKASIPEEEHSQLSIFLQIQQIHKGSPTQFFEMLLYGKDHLMEILTLKLDKSTQLRFKVSPTSFFQPNTAQAERLYSTALQLVSFPKRHVLDLYAGTATLGMAMASRADKVTSIEINPHACFDAESNKELNNLSNLEILCGDVAIELGKLRQRPDFIPPDLVVIDPPRSGLDPAAIQVLKELKPLEILYISCNPETQAANVQELVLFGYRLEALQPVDQFPHTPHIENIVLLRLAILDL